MPLDKSIYMRITGYSIVGVVEFMPVLAVTRVGRYYRTTIPREVRKLLGIGVNDEVEWVFEDGKVVIKKRGG